MSQQNNIPLISWDCECQQSTISISQASCPCCHTPMPKQVRKQIYRQVHRELYAEALIPKSQRWTGFAAISLKIKPLLRLIMCLLVISWVVIVLLLKPDAFTTVWQRCATLPEGVVRQLSGKLTFRSMQPLWEKLQHFSYQRLLDKGLDLLSVIIEAGKLLFQRMVALVQLILPFLS